MVTSSINPWQTSYFRRDELNCNSGRPKWVRLSQEFWSPIMQVRTKGTFQWRFQLFKSHSSLDYIAFHPIDIRPFSHTLVYFSPAINAQGFLSFPWSAQILLQRSCGRLRSAQPRLAPICNAQYVMTHTFWGLYILQSFLLSNSWKSVGNIFSQFVVSREVFAA